MACTFVATTAAIIAIGCVVFVLGGLLLLILQAPRFWDVRDILVTLAFAMIPFSLALPAAVGTLLAPFAPPEGPAVRIVAALILTILSLTAVPATMFLLSLGDR